MEMKRFAARARPRIRALSLLAACVTAASVLTAAVVPAIAAHAMTPGGLMIERRGDDVQVQAHADVAANVGVVWSTLADYDRLEDFIPGLSLSRTLSRSGSDAIVEQQGRARLGPLRRTFVLRLVVQENFQQSISAQMIGGDFKHFSSRYAIEPLGPKLTRIHYRARLAPDLPVPAALSTPIMRSEVERRAQDSGTSCEASYRP
jgi:ribosome-associated toxin RatA of RatAB toxin-antitoxin module